MERRHLMIKFSIMFACFTYLFKAYTAAFLLLLFSYVATVYLFWGIPFIQTTRPIHVAWYLRASRACSWKQLRKYFKNDLDLVSLCMCNSNDCLLWSRHFISVDLTVIAKGQSHSKLMKRRILSTKCQVSTFKGWVHYYIVLECLL
jgi:hypothetical protein